MNTTSVLLGLMLLFGLAVGLIFVGLAWVLGEGVRPLPAFSALSAQGVFAVGAVLAGLLVGSINFLIVRATVGRRLEALSSVMRHVAEGDLEQRIDVLGDDTFDRLAGDVNLVVAMTAAFLTETRDAATRIAGACDRVTGSIADTNLASRQVAATIEHLALGTNQQAESVDSSAQDLNQMDQASQRVAVNAREAAFAATQTAESAQHGQSAIQEAITEMNAIFDAVNTSAAVVLELGDFSQRIGQISGAINTIAGQTNLLALNAAIEAARAGDQGRGFAVVAEEVRKLADESSRSSEQIRAMIIEMQTKTQSAIQSMQEGTLKVGVGVTVIKEAGQALDQIVRAAYQTDVEIQAISEASMELAEGSRKVTKSIENLAAVSQASAAGAEQATATIQEQTAGLETILNQAQLLQDVSQRLLAHVAQFRF